MELFPLRRRRWLLSAGKCINNRVANVIYEVFIQLSQLRFPKSDAEGTESPRKDDLTRYRFKDSLNVSSSKRIKALFWEDK